MIRKQFVDLESVTMVREKIRENKSCAKRQPPMNCMAELGQKQVERDRLGALDHSNSHMYAECTNRHTHIHTQLSRPGL